MASDVSILRQKLTAELQSLVETGNLTAKDYGIIALASTHLGAYVPPPNSKQVVSNGNSVIDWSANAFQTFYFQNIDDVLTFADPLQPMNLSLTLIQSSTVPHVLTFPSYIHWENKTVPSLTNVAFAIDIVHLVFDGTYYFARMTNNYNPI